MERRLDAMLLYSNVLRRLLETFLAFKNPNSTANFTQSMRSVASTLEDSGFQGDADALRLQLTRFTHAHSHSESPETNVLQSPDEIESILSAVFTFICAIDQSHFNGMCTVLALDPKSLLLDT